MPIDSERILDQLTKIEESNTFKPFPRERDLLRFLVETTLAGRTHEIKAATIATDVLRCRLGDRADAEVLKRSRTLASHLRARLPVYYQKEGTSDPIEILLPDSGYIPTIRLSTETSRRKNDAQEDIAPLVAKEKDQRHQVWNIPPRNPYFTGREEYFGALRQALTHKSAPLAITGPAGMGKTQTAIEYAHRYRDDYTAAFWIFGESADSLLSGYAHLATLLNLPHTNEKGVELIAEAVRGWLGAHTDWLLIFDNVDDISVVRRFIPNIQTTNGSCLITTRPHATGIIADSLELGTMDSSEGALFLLRRAKRIPNDGPPDQVPHQDKELAEELVQELGGLPLALEQAGAFIEETPSTLAEYLRLYRNEGAALRRMQGELSIDHLSVTTTFSLAFAKLEAKNPVAADLLRASAFLAPDSIPEELFTKGAAHLGKPLATIVGQPLVFFKAIKDAARFALLRRDNIQESFSLHRLVQEVIKDEMDDGAEATWRERIVHVLAKVVPTREACVLDPELVRQVQRYERHLIYGVQSILNWQFKDIEAATVLRETANYFKDTCDNDKCEGDVEGLRLDRLLNAALYYYCALKIQEELLGLDAPDNAIVLYRLAEVNHSISEFELAEEYYRRALTIWESVEDEHADTASMIACMENYTRLLRDLGRVSDAVVLEDRAIALRKVCLPSAHFPSAGDETASIERAEEQGKRSG